MITLEQEIQLLSRQCQEMEEAIALIHSPQKYEPKLGENSPLDFLRAELSVLSSEVEREKLLQQSQTALKKARAILESKEAELEQLKSDCELINKHILSAGQAVLTMQAGYQQALIQFERLAVENQRRWQQLHPDEELFTKLARPELPVFRMIGAKGLLATQAIARDLD